MKSLGTEDEKEAVKSPEKYGYVFMISDHIYLRRNQVANIMDIIMPAVLHNHRS